MDPTSRRLVARIAIWTGAIVVLMAIWFIAIQPQLAPATDTPGDEDVLVPEETSGKENQAPVAVDDGSGETGDRNSEGEMGSEDPSFNEFAPPEPEPEPEPEDTPPNDAM